MWRRGGTQTRLFFDQHARPGDPENATTYERGTYEVESDDHRGVRQCYVSGQIEEEVGARFYRYVACRDPET